MLCVDQDKFKSEKKFKNDKKSSNFTESEQALYSEPPFDDQMELNGMTQQTNVWNTKIELEDLDLFLEGETEYFETITFRNSSRIVF